MHTPIMWCHMKLTQNDPMMWIIVEGKVALRGSKIVINRVASMSQDETPPMANGCPLCRRHLD